MSEATENAVYVDWGTSSFRAYLVGAAGTCLARKASDQGVKKIAPGTCKSVLQENIGDWVEEAGVTRVLMAGMVGSDLGWCAVPLLNAPCDAAALSDNLFQARLTGATSVQIVPGLASFDGSGRVASIMRGEEVQILGSIALQNKRDALICLPGSHSKWVGINAGSITAIRTFMTGELFDLVCTRSVLADCLQGADAELDIPAFLSGVDRVRSGETLLEALFGVRAEFVADPHRTAVERKSFVSGVMIGSEIDAPLANASASQSGDLIVVGSKKLLEAYRLAFAQYDCRPTCIDGEEAFIAGCHLLLA